ncbi:MAG: ATP-binding protein [Bacteroidota bacterium]
MTPTHPKPTNLTAAIDYLQRLVRARIEIQLGKSEGKSVSAPTFEPAGDPFSRFIQETQPEFEAYVTLLAALVPEVQPDFFDEILKEYFKPGTHFPAFGGIRGKQHKGIIPTGETIQFLVAGKDLAKRAEVRQLLRPDNWLATKGMLRLLPTVSGEPLMSGQLLADAEWVERMLVGNTSTPSFSTSFPATRVHTSLKWKDLVLPARTLADLAPIQHYLKHHQDLEGNPGFGRHARRGYRALFHGPPGTGKTLTAGLIGKAADRLVFRVDLSMVISKYIGETEKNLAALFQKAENKGWILFFDEADALFGKRTDVKESKDRYANQETSYLLQRVEQYDGLVILATNFKRNMDKAFTRRFESIVHFPAPGAEERYQLWQKMWPVNLAPAQDIDLQEVAKRFELTGAAIANLLRHATYESFAQGKREIELRLLQAAVRREYEKEERIFSK